MTSPLNEAVVEEAALGWLEELRWAYMADIGVHKHPSMCILALVYNGLVFIPLVAPNLATLKSTSHLDGGRSQGSAVGDFATG